MKKNLFLLTVFVVISACSSDDSSSDSTDNLVLPKTISMAYPDFPSDNSKDVITYDGNKILKLVDEDSKTVYTYDGNLIVKQVKFDLDDKGNEVKDAEVSYSYENGKLKTKISAKEFSTEFPDGAFINKTVYTHVSNNQVLYVHYYVDPNTKNETKRSEGTLNYKDGNLVKEESVANDNKVTRTYEYDTKNNPLKNILSFNLLLKEANAGINNILKITMISTEFSTPSVYVSDYLYNDKGYPTKQTSFTSSGKTVEYEMEYTY